MLRTRSGDENDQFFESFDQMPLASTSGSESEEDYDRRNASLKASQRSSAVGNDALYSRYEIWKSEPCSVQQRRERLFQQFGLSEENDSISTSKIVTAPSSLTENLFDKETSYKNVYRSVSHEESLLHSTGSSQCNSSAAAKLEEPRVNVWKEEDISCSVLSSVESNSLASKSPRISFSVLPLARSRIDSEASSNSDSPYSQSCANSDSPYSQSRIFTERRADVASFTEEPLCLIKNLDTGEKFLVNEFDKDGMWNKLKEAETGRQLSREEFERAIGCSPLVDELMRRESVEKVNEKPISKAKTKGGWLKSVKHTFLGSKEKNSGAERDLSSEKAEGRSNCATDDGHGIFWRTPQWTRVHHHGKPFKEFTALYMGQEISAHQGSIWAIEFSVDGRYLATAGQDRVIHIWKAMKSERRDEPLDERTEEGLSSIYVTGGGSSDLFALHIDSIRDKNKNLTTRRRSSNVESVMLPKHLFLLSEKPKCSFQGHTDDVLALSWSRSRLLLSSSMDKTVRLWHIQSKSCLRIFSHNDFVTCIQFNPVDDRFFLSGSLDKKVRIWSIPDRQIVDWADLHEMVTAASYTPDGQAAYVGTHKGDCHLYNTSGNKLQEEAQVNIQNKKKKSPGKKITGFQFAPGSSQKVLITSADSQIRVFDGSQLIKKYKGFKNTNSQICASFTPNGKYVISASEDSSVYIWNNDFPNTPAKNQGTCQAYEFFALQNVYSAIPWPGLKIEEKLSSKDEPLLKGIISTGQKSNPFPASVHSQGLRYKLCSSSSDSIGEIVNTKNDSKEEMVSEEISPGNSSAGNGQHTFFDLLIADTLSEPFQSSLAFSSSQRPLQKPNSDQEASADSVPKGSATWPEEKLASGIVQGPTVSEGSPFENSVSVIQDESPELGLVIVTAGHDGRVRTFQNYGWSLPSR